MSNNWTKEEEVKLLDLVSKGLTIEEIAKSLNRPYNSIKGKKNDLKRWKPLQNEKSGKDKTTLSDFVQSPLYTEIVTSIVKEVRKNIYTTKEHKPKIVTKGTHEETAVLLLSDIHNGMINRNPLTGEITYNDEIKKSEGLYLRDSIFNIHNLLSSSYTIKNLVIFGLGDIVTNDRIFEGQKFEINKCVGSQIWDSVSDLAYFINEMKKKFETITFIGVVGNHGRSVPDYQEEPVQNNFEYHLYKILQKTFEGDKRVKIIVPDTRTAFHTIYNHKYLLSHGDSVRGLTRNYIASAIREILVALPEGFDVYCIGHFHRCETMDLTDRSILLVNGSWIEKDAYGYKMFRQFSSPRQWFFGVSKKRAVTFWYRIDLRNPEE